MDRDALQARFYLLFRQATTNTSLSTSDCVNLLNEGYQQLMRPKLDSLTTNTRYTLPSTTVTTASGTSLVVASVSNFQALTYVMVKQGSRADLVRVSSIDGPTKTLTLASPGIVYTGFTTAATVRPASVIIADAKYITNLNWHVWTASTNLVYPVEPMRDRDYFKLGDQPQSDGIPTKYMIVSPTEVMLYPPPDTAGYLEVRYAQKSSFSLSAGGSTPELDVDDHMGIVFYALAMAFLREGRTDIYNIYAAEFNKVMGSVVAGLNRKYAESQTLDFEKEALE